MKFPIYFKQLFVLAQVQKKMGLYCSAAVFAIFAVSEVILMLLLSSFALEMPWNDFTFSKNTKKVLKI